MYFDTSLLQIVEACSHVNLKSLKVDDCISIYECVSARVLGERHYGRPRPNTCEQINMYMSNADISTHGKQLEKLIANLII